MPALHEGAGRHRIRRRDSAGASCKSAAARSYRRRAMRRRQESVSQRPGGGRGRRVARYSPGRRAAHSARHQQRRTTITSRSCLPEAWASASTRRPGKLHVQTGGIGSWDRFVVKTTNLWGDGPANQIRHHRRRRRSGHHVLQPARGRGMPPEGRASIRMGRSGGVLTGHWWDIGVRAGNTFSIFDGHERCLRLSITRPAPSR